MYDYDDGAIAMDGGEGDAGRGGGAGARGAGAARADSIGSERDISARVRGGGDDGVRQGGVVVAVEVLREHGGGTSRRLACRR